MSLSDDILEFKEGVSELAGHYHPDDERSEILGLAAQVLLTCGCIVGRHPDVGTAEVLEIMEQRGALDSRVARLFCDYLNP